MQLLPDLSVRPAEQIAEGTIEAPKHSLDFLRAVYCNEGLPLPVRMRAAIAALLFKSPNLAVTANVQGEGFAALLEARLRKIAQQKPEAITIEATPEPQAPLVPDRRSA